MFWQYLAIGIVGIIVGVMWGTAIMTKETKPMAEFTLDLTGDGHSELKLLTPYEKLLGRKTMVTRVRVKLPEDQDLHSV